MRSGPSPGKDAFYRGKLLLAAALLAGLGGCGKAPDRPASSDQLAKLDQVVERVPGVADAAAAAREDGVVTEHEIIAIFERAERLQRRAQ